jgi:hypothetical protein
LTNRNNHRSSDVEDCKLVQKHYIEVWSKKPHVLTIDKGPAAELGKGFRVLEFSPATRQMWTYATACMSSPSENNPTKGAPLELHLFAPGRNRSLVEILAAAAHYHRTASPLGLGHTVNFGRPWWPESVCDHGLISLPYLDGPRLEWLQTPRGMVRFLWLIPITLAEVRFMKQRGLEALERRFEIGTFNYVDPKRKSVV